MESQAPEDSLIEYVSKHDMIVQIGQNILLVGEMQGRSFWLTAEEAKRLIRSILKFIVNNHRNNKCLGPFNETNITVTSSGRAKFNHVDLEDKSDAGLRRNFEDARNIILNTIIKGYTLQQIPVDILHLICLKRYQLTKGYFISNHASLVPVVNMAVLANI